MENITPTHWVRTNVRRLRTEKGLTLADLSERMTSEGHPLALNVLSRIESGGRAVDVDDLVNLAAALDVTPTELLADPVILQNAPIFDLLERWRLALIRRSGAIRDVETLTGELAELVQEHPVSPEGLEMIEDWADRFFKGKYPEDRAALFGALGHTAGKGQD